MKRTLSCALVTLVVTAAFAAEKPTFTSVWKTPVAYETLLLDAIRGDSTLFTRQDSVERAWEICDPLIEQWQTGQPQLYTAGSWGPDAADELLSEDGRRWRRP